MALTAAGRALTKAYHSEQAVLVDRAVAGIAPLAVQTLDPHRLDATRDIFAAAAAGYMEAQSAQFSLLATAYLDAYRRAEAGPEAARKMRLETVPFNPESAHAVLDGIVARSKYATKIGQPAAEAVAGSLQARRKSIHKELLRASRASIDLSTKESRVRYRRTGGPGACKFCAILISRGPVYHSEDTAGRWKQYHGGCSCVIEEHYGAWDDWVPTTEELPYIAEYYRAARLADAKYPMTRTLDTVLEFMGTPWLDKPGN